MSDPFVLHPDGLFANPRLIDPIDFEPVMEKVRSLKFETPKINFTRPVAPPLWATAIAKAFLCIPSFVAGGGLCYGAGYLLGLALGGAFPLWLGFLAAIASIPIWIVGYRLLMFCFSALFA